MFTEVPVEAQDLCVAEGEAEGRKIWGVGWGCGSGQLLFGLVKGRRELDFGGFCSFLFSSSTHLLFDLLLAFTRHTSTCWGAPEFLQMWPWCTALQGPGSGIILPVSDGIQCYLSSQDYPAW